MRWFLGLFCVPQTQEKAEVPGLPSSEIKRRMGLARNLRELRARLREQDENDFGPITVDHNIGGDSVSSKVRCIMSRLKASKIQVVIAYFDDVGFLDCDVFHGNLTSAEGAEKWIGALLEQSGIDEESAHTLEVRERGGYACIITSSRKTGRRLDIYFR